MTVVEVECDEACDSERYMVMIKVKDTVTGFDEEMMCEVEVVVVVVVVERWSWS